MVFPLQREGYSIISFREEHHPFSLSSSWEKLPQVAHPQYLTIWEGEATPLHLSQTSFNIPITSLPHTSGRKLMMQHIWQCCDRAFLKQCTEFFYWNCSYRERVSSDSDYIHFFNTAQAFQSLQIITSVFEKMNDFQIYNSSAAIT